MLVEICDQPNWKHRFTRIAIAAAFALLLYVQPVAAQSSVCPDGQTVTNQPVGDLIGFLNSVVELAFAFGVLFGVLGLIVGGTLMAAPLGPEWAQRGRDLVKRTIFGSIIIFSAQTLIKFIASELGADICVKTAEAVVVMPL